MIGRISISAALVIVAVSAAPALAMAADCAEVARAFAAELTLSAGAANEDGALRRLQESALSGIRSCPDLEPQLYIAARTAELGYAAGAPRGNGPTVEARNLAYEASMRQPRSARIATVLARIDGTVAAARRAYEIDPNYTPARLQLVLALAAAGSKGEALSLLPSGKMMDTASERIARARVLLAAGEAQAAAGEAEAAHRARKPEAEIVPGRDLERDAQEVLGFALLASHRVNQAESHLKAAAALGSTKARAQLLNKP
jgi:hypothetical protein